MKGLRATTGAVSLSLLGGLVAGVPAHAADEPITITWADDTHQAIRVTWPADDKANRASVMQQGTSLRTVNVKAASPDTADIPIKGLPNADLLRIDVFGQESDTVWAKVGSSKDFDSRVRSAAFLKTQAGPNGTVKLSWNIVTGGDDTPGDPLDLPLPYNSRPLVSAPVGCDWQELPAIPGQQVTTTLPAHSLPYRVSTRTTEEWGSWDHWPEQIAQYAPGLLSFPTKATYGDLVDVRGKFEAISAGPCTAGKPVPAVRTPVRYSLALQTRVNATSPWATLYKDVWPDEHGVFATNLFAVGGRQYRFFAASASNRDFGTDVGMAFEGSTAIANFTTSYKLNTAKFVDTTVAPGKPAVVRIGVLPANNIRTTLQKWNGKAWVAVKWVYLGKGVGQYTFPAPAAGNHAYRFVVPPTTVNGLPVAGITTGTMTLVVR